MPSPSFSGPAAVRGLHPSGFEEKFVTNFRDIDGVDPKRYALRISASVGMKKKIQMMEQAKKAGLRVFNPKIVQKVVEKKEEKKVEVEKKES